MNDFEEAVSLIMANIGKESSYNPSVFELFLKLKDIFETPYDEQVEEWRDRNKFRNKEELANFLKDYVDNGCDNEGEIWVDIIQNGSMMYTSYIPANMEELGDMY